MKGRKINKKEMDTMIKSNTDNTSILGLLYLTLTYRINDLEIFMKGINYSCYYEDDGNEDIKKHNTPII